MDADFSLNLEELAQNIDTAEVLTIYFPLLRKSLVVDMRTTPWEGPMVRVVPMVRSPEERYRSIKRMRPHFPRPQSLTLLPWPKYVDSLVRLGIYDRLLARLSATGDPGAVQACKRAFGHLRRLERQEITAVIRGETYHAIWSRRGE